MIMLPIQTPVRLVDKRETGIIVGRCYMEPPYYNVRIGKDILLNLAVDHIEPISLEVPEAPANNNGNKS